MSAWGIRRNKTKWNETKQLVIDETKRNDWYISLGKTFLRISRIQNIPLTWILARVFIYVPPFISQILDLIHWMVLIFYFDLFWMAWHWKTAIQARNVHWNKYDVRCDFRIFYEIDEVGSIFKIRLLLLCAVSSCRITVSGDRRYFGHGSRKCSSDMRRF